MIVSHEAKKKQAICNERVCYLHAAPLEFVNVLNKLPFRLVIKDSARSNYTESVTQQWRKLASPILNTSHCEFYGIVLAPMLEKPSPWHPFTHLLDKYSTSIAGLQH